MKEQVYKSTFYSLISSFTTDFVRQILKTPSFQQKWLTRLPLTNHETKIITNKAHDHVFIKVYLHYNKN